jgi:5S rRNA maturation endonuclease (ribonuclease M5)
MAAGSIAFGAITAELDRRGLLGAEVGGQREAVCPAHDDKRASLRIRDVGDRALVYCHAGCKLAAILNALGMPDSAASDYHWTGDGNREPEAIYSYVAEDGKPLYEVRRFEGKSFVAYLPGANSSGIGKTRRVLYRLPRVIDAVRNGRLVFIVEGEKDVQAIERAGGVATCNPFGAGKGKWKREYSEVLRGGHIVVVADRDEPGRDFARTIAASLDKIAADVTIVEAREGKDASDHFAAGFGFADFVLVASDTAEDESRPRSTGRHPRFLDMTKAMSLGPPAYLCKPIIADGAVTTVTGIRGDNKTWLGMMLCNSIESGGEFAGLNCRQGNALYIDVENGERIMGNRFTLLGIDPNAFTVADGTGIHLPRDVNVIRDMIADSGASFVVLDSLRRLAPRADESSSNDMTPIYEALTTLARSTGCALLVLHHRSPKFGAADSRGSSAIEDQSDLFFVLERIRNDPERAFRRRLRNTKARIDAEPPPLWLSFKTLGGFMTVAQAEPFDTTDARGPSIVERLVAKLRELAPRVREEDGWSPARLGMALGGRPANDNSLRQALGIVVDLDDWEVIGSTRARRYRPPPSDSSFPAISPGDSSNSSNGSNPQDWPYDAESERSESPGGAEGDRSNSSNPDDGDDRPEGDSS